MKAGVDAYDIGIPARDKIQLHNHHVLLQYIITQTSSEIPNPNRRDRCIHSDVYVEFTILIHHSEAALFTEPATT